MRRGQLVVMLKVPRPGRVKTRLGRDIGQVAAAWWFRHQVAGLLRRLRDPRWDIVLAVAPDAEGLAARVWPADLARRAQGRGDLGARMARQLRAAPGPVCLVGGDIPGMTRAHVARAFRALGAADAVLGPAPDGGFWLIGLSPRRAPPPGLFDGARWSTAHALEDTLKSLADRRVALVDTLRDVDTAADLVGWVK
ncbi:TIGR04282 family arsenosugar biosynthesis glycosyltransferase [Marinibacterium sp. SX1]|uniref:TIGR04282 family arsenosugar biosynthesis glycosyltransferase n=1 Tax=Marinibacterium sp. SX1 TaxID=3388424 RepID=UPI003D166D47